MGLWGKVRKVFGSGEDAATAPATPQQLLATEMEAAIRGAFPEATVRPAPETLGLLVTRPGHTEQTVFLDNVFAETRDMGPEQRRERLARFVRSLDTPDATAMSWDEVRPKLAPLLRTPTLFGGSLPRLTGDRVPIHRPFAPFLVECVGIDSEVGIAYVAPHMLAGWGVHATEVFDAAVENGRGYFTSDVEPFDPQAPYPLWHVARDDSYESSRLLVPGWLASFAGKVTGRPVAIVPHRSLLIIGGDGDERCLRRLIDSAKGEFQASPRNISPALFTVDDEGKVVPLVLPAGHPLAADVAVGHVMAAMAEYDLQKAQLEHLEEDVFIASYKGLKGDDGSVYSYTTWSRGVPSLLPETDQVVLGLAPGQKGGEILRVPWQVLMEIAGGCLAREPDLDPPRWRTTGWPEETVIAKLRAAVTR